MKKITITYLDGSQEKILCPTTEVMEVLTSIGSLEEAASQGIIDVRVN